MDRDVRIEWSNYVCTVCEAWTKGKVGPIQLSWASPPPPLTLFMISPSTHQLSHEKYMYITGVEALLSKYACGSKAVMEVHVMQKMIIASIIF